MIEICKKFIILMFEWSITLHVCHIISMNTVDMQCKSYHKSVSNMVEKSFLSSSSSFTKMYICPTCLEQSAYCASMVSVTEEQKLRRLV